MNIFEIFSTVNDELFKDETGNVYTPQDFNLRLLSVNVDYFKQRFGLPEGYQPGRPFPQMGWQETQKITDDLRKVLVHKGDDHPPLYFDKLGFTDLPDDYWHPSTLYTNDADVEILPDDQFAARLRSPLVGPKTKDPICRILANQIQIAPKEINYAKFTYLKEPTTAFMDYDLVDGGVVYLPEGTTHQNDTIQPPGTPSRTVQLGWPSQTHTDIINLLVNYASKKLRSPFLYQESERRKEKGI